MCKHYEHRDGRLVSQAIRLRSVKGKKDYSALTLLAYAIPAAILAAFVYPLIAFVASVVGLFVR